MIEWPAIPTVTGMTTTETTFDPAKVEAFAGRLMPIVSSALLSYMIDLGDRTGLFGAAAAGTGTSREIAERAGLHERYVREWLGAMATAGIFEYEPSGDTYRLPAEHAVLLCGPGSMAPLAHANTTLGRHVTRLAEVFREGGGIPYEEYTPDFTDAMDGMGRGGFDQFLIDAYLPMVPGLTEKLAAGIRVADLACGTGHALNLLAQAFPASTFVGYDLDRFALERAEAEAKELGLTNVSFEAADITTVEPAAPCDVVFMFDALHDQVDPPAVLSAMRSALTPDGTLFLREPHAADTLAGNLGNPMAAVQYCVSTLHCLTVSLAHGGAGIGTVFGEQQARTLLQDAGFEDPVMHPAPGHPFDVVYITTPRPPDPRRPRKEVR
jgi:SAM-dependent methyltransferase